MFIAIVELRETYCCSRATKRKKCQCHHVVLISELVFSSGSCLICPEGTTCPYNGMNQTLDCPMGHYCFNGTTDNGNPCPIGKHEDIVDV